MSNMTPRSDKIAPARSVTIGRSHAVSSLADTWAPPDASDAAKVRQIALWRRLWSCASSGELARAEEVIATMSVADREEAKDVVARFMPRKIAHGNGRFVAITPKNRASTGLRAGARKSAVIRDISSPPEALDGMFRSLIARSKDGPEAVWSEFRDIAIVDQGILLVRLLEHYGRDVKLPDPSGVMEYQWHGAGAYAKLAIFLYRKRSAHLKERRL